MRTTARRVLVLLVLLSSVACFTAVGLAVDPPSDAAAQSVGEEVPTLADEPSAAAVSSDSPNYGAWSLVATCLILAGWLLVRVEKWAARRLPAEVPSG